MVASAPIRARAATPDSTIMPNFFNESPSCGMRQAGFGQRAFNRLALASVDRQRPHRN